MWLPRKLNFDNSQRGVSVGSARKELIVPRYMYTDSVVRPNIQFSAARRRRSSPTRPGQSMSRNDLAEAVNAHFDQLAATEDRVVPHVGPRWIAKLERGDYRWPRDDCRAALRHVLAVATDADLGLHRPARRDA
jgi:hypothetical protein